MVQATFHHTNHTVTMSLLPSSCELPPLTMKGAHCNRFSCWVMVRLSRQPNCTKATLLLCHCCQVSVRCQLAIMKGTGCDPFSCSGIVRLSRPPNNTKHQQTIMIKAQNDLKSLPPPLARLRFSPFPSPGGVPYLSISALPDNNCWSCGRGALGLEASSVWHRNNSLSGGPQSGWSRGCGLPSGHTSRDVRIFFWQFPLARR